jgi:hypothetical protein
MKQLVPALICALICGWRTPCRAEDAIEDFQTWSQLQAVLDMDRVLPGLSGTLESTVRRGSPALIDHETGRQVEAPLTYLFVRPSIGYDVCDWFNATLGYAWAPVYYDAAAQRAGREVREHRVWEQATFARAFSGLSLASRTRLEERMRTLGPGEGDTELRLRQRFRAARSLVSEAPWQLIMTDELLFFLNRTDFVSVPGFSENRAFVGVGYRGDGVAVEIGYLNQFVGGRSGHHHDNHVLSTSVTFAFAWPEAS